MRFLLYPRRTALSASKLLKGKTTESYVVEKANAAADPVALTLTSAVPPPSSSSSSTTSSHTSARQQRCQGERPLSRAWGQQCSSTCGCIVRFEATYDSESQRIRSASYRAKSLVTTLTPALLEQQNAKTKNSLQAVLTTKGRPMLTECKCSTLHHLSSAIVEHMVQQTHASRTSSTIPKLASSLEFNSLRSSVAFRQTVLKTQGLSETDTHCFDVVEEAITALVKGRMPKPRKQEEITMTKIIPDEQEEDVEEEGDDEESFSFYPSHRRRRNHSAFKFIDDDDSPLGQFLWKHHDYRILHEDRISVSTSNAATTTSTTADCTPRSMSTLRMFDDAELEAEQAKNKNTTTTAVLLPPADWISFVDELYQKYETQQSA